MKRLFLPALLLAILAAGLQPLDPTRLVATAYADGEGGDGGDGGDGDGGDGDGGDGDGGDGDGDSGDSDGSDSDGDDGDSDDSDDSDGSSDDGPESAGDEDGDREDPISSLIDRVFGSDRDVVAGELVALTASELSASQTAALQARGYAVLEDTGLSGIQARALRIAVPPNTDLDDAEEDVRAILPGATIDQNDLYDLAGIGCDEDCWAASLVALGSSGPSACSRGAPIALLDTMVARDHPSLGGADVTVQSFLSESMRSASPYHGTAIAALLVGQSAPGAEPLAPGARLVAAEVIGTYDGEPRGDVLAIVKALNWAAEARVRVVALSLEGGANKALHLAIRRVAVRANIIAAAGNNGPSGDPAFPAAYPEVIAVSAVDSRLRPYRNGTRGAYVELAAPGVNIISAGSGGSRQVWTGTSFAVPFAVAATLRARAVTDGDPVAARELLRGQVRDLGAPGADEVYGYGLIQSPGDRCW